MIAVVGSSNFDVVFKVQEFTLPGQTQRAISLEYHPGGKGANQAVTVAKLSNRPVVFISCLGRDQFGEELRRILESHGITGFIQLNEKNGLAFIEVTSDGRNRIVIFPGANGKLDVPTLYAHRDALRGASVVLLQNEIPIETTMAAAQLSKEAGATVILDPAPASGIPISVLSYVDYLTPNEVELEELSRMWFGDAHSPEGFFRKVFSLNPTIKLLVKLGERGATMFTSQDRLEVVGLKVDAVDTTAAGDVFNGAFAVALSEGRSELEALHFANVAAALSVTRPGAQSSIPTRDEVESVLRNSQDRPRG